MIIDNNKKTEAIKDNLVLLLKELANRKQMIATRKSYIYIDCKIPPYVPRDELESLNIGTSTLSNLIKQFKSVDDFNSVKKLRETEFFFLKNQDIKEFTFSSYKSQIDPNLIDHVNIEIRLDKISKKAKNLDQRGYHSESIIAKGVVTELEKLNHWYFEEKSIDPNDYKTRALAIIDEAKPILKEHRGCKRILTNLTALISTLGIAFIVNKCVNNRFLFFPETKSSEQLTKLEHWIPKLAF
jgi:hypothetical protein